jgi:hypothetical protein
MVSNLNTPTFIADHPDDLKTGLQPFVVMDGSKAFCSESLKNAQNYTLLSEHNFGLSFNDFAHFNLPKELQTHPISFFESEKGLGLFGSLIHVILRTQHHITHHYKLFWDAFIRQFCNEVHYEIDSRKVIKPARILWNIQLLCYQGFQVKKHNIEPPQPNFFTSSHASASPCIPTPIYPVAFTN